MSVEWLLSAWSCVTQQHASPAHPAPGFRPDEWLNSGHGRARVASGLDRADGRQGLPDDGRYLYAIHADAQKLFGWAVGQGGQLTPVGEFGGVPDTVAGLAAS